MVWDIDREIVSWGSFALRWYSLLFALGFVVGYFIVQEMFKKEGRSLQVLDSLLFHLVIGTVVGARLGHCLFYEPDVYLSDPIRILKVWEGGLASHGGFTGVIISIWLFCRKHPDFSFFWLADRLTFPSMLAGAMIRVGNFFNSEILGKPAPADLPWGVVFKRFDNELRHPAQLYEALGYFIITALLYLTYRLSGRRPKEGRLLGMMFALAFTFRLVIEFYKIDQVGFEAGMPLNMGQLLSIPFIFLGVFLFFGGAYKVPFLRRGVSPEALEGAGYDPVDTVVGGELPMAAMTGGSRRGQLRKQSKKVK